jgi:DNA repair protein RecO (recombination protein O)
MKQKTTGILIRKKNYSESSLILSFYTEESGLMSFIYKGAKKKKVSIFYLGIYEISYFRRPESNLGIIQSIESSIFLSDIFTNPQKMILSFFLVDVLKETLKEEQRDVLIFEFIKSQIFQLEIQNDLLLFPIQFLASFIKHLGFLPLLEVNIPKGFDLISSQFTENSNQYDESSVQLIHSVFLSRNIKADKKTAQKALLILLDYCKIHFPNFNNDNSFKIIKDTLYV